MHTNGMRTTGRASSLVVATILLVTVFAAAQTRQEFHFKVHRRASISILNVYGPISVKPTSAHQVVVVAILHSTKVAVDQNQRGNRISVSSRLLPDADAESGRVEYEVQVPADASLTLNSTTGPLRAEKLHGDLVLEGNTATVDVRDVNEGHVHVKTLDGAVTLSNVNDGHVEITSVSGDVALNSVTGPLVHVNSSSGKISYYGDFGGGGEYLLASHTGDIEAVAPANASIEVVARSMKGTVENDFLLDPPRYYPAMSIGSAFAGTINKAASSVRLLSFSGKIHLKKR